MRIERVDPDEVTLVGILNSCANLGVFELGKWVHAYVDKNQITVEGYIGNALLIMLGYGPGQSPFGQANATESGISPKELALQNTRLMLGRIRDSCALGRRRDYRRVDKNYNTSEGGVDFDLMQIPKVENILQLAKRAT
ncbi:hypothetical protein RD792_008852 [Penstemon davidsonii]|uniref:Uncharacterized protein n=1 Tax=Penstemon davidsonii TaxID=160366 RepID=A0ABR0DA99_9LAMI|nr:hypothetical protein RD792_008852 [Penstemon davidsonii]